MKPGYKTIQSYGLSKDNYCILVDIIQTEWKSQRLKEKPKVERIDQGTCNPHNQFLQGLRPSGRTGYVAVTLTNFTHHMYTITETSHVKKTQKWYLSLNVTFVLFLLSPLTKV